MIGTDENRAVLHVEVVFWSGKRKTLPSLVSGKYCPHFVVTGTAEYLGVCFLDGDECAFSEPALGNAQPLYPDTVDYSALADEMCIRDRYYGGDGWTSPCSLVVS